MVQGYDFDDEDYEHDNIEMPQYPLDVIHSDQTTMDASNDEPIEKQNF
jgi:hypothetical protein